MNDFFFAGTALARFEGSEHMWCKLRFSNNSLICRAEHRLKAVYDRTALGHGIGHGTAEIELTTSSATQQLRSSIDNRMGVIFRF